MNARQAKKYLKKRIDRLTCDNELMRKIIDNSPEMSRLYDRYNQPYNVSTMSFEEYRVRKIIPRYHADNEDYKECIRHALVGGLAEVIKQDIHFETVEICGEKAIEASVYIGRK